MLLLTNATTGVVGQICIVFSVFFFRFHLALFRYSSVLFLILLLFLLCDGHSSADKTKEKKLYKKKKKSNGK